MKNIIINLDKLSRKSEHNLLEVEDLLNVAIAGDKSHADFIDDLSNRFNWLDEEAALKDSKVPLAEWSKVVSVYLREGFSGLAALVDTKSNDGMHSARFVISLLEELHTNESVECLIKIFDSLLCEPDINNPLIDKLINAFNMLLSFPPMINIDEGSENKIRNFLHKLIDLNPSETEMAGIYCALRGVGNDSSIDYIKKGALLKGPWKGTEKVVINIINQKKSKGHET